MLLKRGCVEYLTHMTCAVFWLAVITSPVLTVDTKQKLLTEPPTCDGQTDKCSWQQWTLSFGSTVDEIHETPETESKVISPSNTIATAYSSSGKAIHWTVMQFHKFAERDSPGLTNKMSLPSFVFLLLRVPCPSHLWGIYCSKVQTFPWKLSLCEEIWLEYLLKSP
jgi:hypothetical protein